MKKKLTLNQTWTLCLKQWKWIIEQLDAGSEKAITVLKQEWLKRNGYKTKEIWATCFFCEYVASRRNFSCQENCRARLIAKRFHCERAAYNYSFEPRKFYKVIFGLNEKRKAQKEKK